MGEADLKKLFPVEIPLSDPNLLLKSIAYGSIFPCVFAKILSDVLGGEVIAILFLSNYKTF